ncbi:hypothetical protein LUZ62_052335 [Rhynchospora pubera]|uniref:Ubiquitin receptor RAD23 n=1 Tax=Rhynchospora pubera TaxID=906938 RepID=A0AAV8G7P2_9POAL|nr:hypothetical protein LUZ62_052335 [Rhynchospora pubera]
MKIFVKTLKGTSFEIDVKPEDTVADVKRAIESTQGSNVYPANQLMLIHQGSILKDDTTLEESKVVENSFVVVMLSKSKATSSGSTAAPKAPENPAPAPPTSTPSTAPSEPTPVTPATPAATIAGVPPVPAVNESEDVYGQAASNLVGGTNLEATIQQLIEMGGGNWDRDTVARALRAAFNNPERAVEYLYSGIPEHLQAPAPAAQAPATGVPPPSAGNPVVQPPAAPVAGSGPNANPLDLFPRELPNAGSNANAGGIGSLEMLRNSPQFRALLALVQSNPQILQPMLQELGKQNPQILRLIQENQAEFLRLINEAPEGAAEGDLLGQLADAMPQTVEVTPEEREALERLEAMGFDRALVLEVFFACNKNEELAANYLLDHMHEFEDDQQ